MKNIDNSNIRKALLKALQEGMKYEDMTPRMQKEYDKIAPIANALIMGVLEQIKGEHVTKQSIDLLGKMANDGSLNDLTDEENQLKQILIESLSTNMKDKLEVAEDKKRLLSNIKMKAKSLGNKDDIEYQEVFIEGIYLIKLLGNWMSFMPSQYDDLIFIIKHADSVEVAEYVDENRPDLSVELSFDFTSYLK